MVTQKLKTTDGKVNHPPLSAPQTTSGLLTAEQLEEIEIRTLEQAMARRAAKDKETN